MEQTWPRPLEENAQSCLYSSIMNSSVSPDPWQPAEKTCLILKQYKQLISESSVEKFLVSASNIYEFVAKIKRDIKIDTFSVVCQMIICHHQHKLLSSDCFLIVHKHMCSYWF